jgi:rod shape-determining protein MreC
VNTRTLYVLVALVLGHVLLISAQVQSHSGIPVIQTVAFGTFARVQLVIASIADGGRAIWSNYFALRGAVRENEDLKRQILELEAQLQQARARAIGIQALERALGLRASLPITPLAARVIAGAPSPGLMAVTIDRGWADGVQRDMAVLGHNGLVGRVINEPQEHASQVQLLVDRSAAVAVFFERTGTGGIVVGGSGDPPMRVTDVPNSAQIEAGDVVLSSGQDRLYPRGFAVGTVSHAERGRDGAWTVLVEPAVDFSHIDIVLVLLGMTPQATETPTK